MMSYLVYIFFLYSDFLIWFDFVYCQEDSTEPKEDMKVFSDLQYCKIYYTLTETQQPHYLCLNPRTIIYSLP